MLFLGVFQLIFPLHFIFNNEKTPCESDYLQEYIQ
jgi:hypothetical protein